MDASVDLKSVLPIPRNLAMSSSNFDKDFSTSLTRFVGASSGSMLVFSEFSSFFGVVS